MYKKKSIPTVHSLSLFSSSLLPSTAVKHYWSLSYNLADIDTHTHTYICTHNISEGPWAACPSAVAGHFTKIFSVPLGVGERVGGGGGGKEEAAAAAAGYCLSLAAYLSSLLFLRGDTSSKGLFRLSSLQLVRLG